MQRPVRLIVFGVLCFVVGFFSMISNTAELATSAIGPSIIPAQEAPADAGMFAELMYAQNQAIRKALSRPSYRVLRGTESGVGLLMVGVLCVAGVGLIRGTRWGVRLVQGWAVYAIFAAVGSVLLEVRYVLPHVQAGTPMPAGGELFAGVFTLLLLWVFPVLALILLGRPVVWDYVSAPRRPASAAARLSQLGPPMPDRPAPRPTQASSPNQPTPAGPEPEPTWRDDPWNDPQAR